MSNHFSILYLCLFWGLSTSLGALPRGGGASCASKLIELARPFGYGNKTAKLKITFDQNRAEELIGPLSTAQMQIIEKAHRVGDGEIGRDGKRFAAIGNYTDQQLQDKYTILAESGFSKSQIKMLMDNGIVGRNDLTRDYYSGDLDDDFAPRGGRTTEGTKNNKGVRTAAQQVQEAGTLAKLTDEERIEFGEAIHAVKKDPNCPKDWIDIETGDLTWTALMSIARGIKKGQSTFY